MNQEQVLLKLTQILRDLLANDEIVLGMDTRRSDVPNWDSFAYVNFIYKVLNRLFPAINLHECDAFEFPVF